MHKMFLYKNYSEKRDFSIFLIILLAFIILTLNWPFLNNPLIFDDVPFFENLDSSEFFYKIFQIRSLPYATFYWGELWFGQSLARMRLENIALHIFTVISIYLFSLNLYLAVGWADKLKTQYWAFFVAAVFALHPLCTYAVGYLVQRTILMATLFCILSMLAYVKSTYKNNLRWAWVSVVCYGFAVQSKEHAFALPVSILALSVVLSDDWLKHLKARKYIFLAFFVMANFTIMQTKGIIGSVYENSAPSMLPPNELTLTNSILTQARLFFKYIALWIIPNPNWMSIDIREKFASAGSLVDYGFVLLYLLWGIVGFLFLKKNDKRKIIGLSLIYPWIMFWTEFSTIRVQEIFVLYRSYLWMPVLVCFFPLAATYLTKNSIRFILAAVFLSLPLISLDRLITLSNSILLWQDANKLVENESNLPGSYRIHYNLGVELIKYQRYDEAIAELNKAIAKSVDFAEARNNIGVAYLKKSEWTKAIAQFTIALDIVAHRNDNSNNRYHIDSMAKSAYGRARAYAAIGKLDDASKDYTLSCNLGGVGCEFKNNLKK